MVRLPRLVTRPLHRLTADVERVAGPGPATRVAVVKNNEVGTVAAAVNRVLRQAEDERRATLAELITQRNRTESLVRSLDEGLLLIDQQGHYCAGQPRGLPATGRRAGQGNAGPARRPGGPGTTRCCASGWPWRCTAPHPAENGSLGTRRAFLVRPHGENLHYQLTIYGPLRLSMRT